MLVKPNSTAHNVSIGTIFCLLELCNMMKELWKSDKKYESHVHFKHLMI